MYSVLHTYKILCTSLQESAGADPGRDGACLGSRQAQLQRSSTSTSPWNRASSASRERMHQDNSEARDWVGTSLWPQFPLAPSPRFRGELLPVCLRSLEGASQTSPRIVSAANQTTQALPRASPHLNPLPNTDVTDRDASRAAFLFLHFGTHGSGVRRRGKPPVASNNPPCPKIKRCEKSVLDPPSPQSRSSQPASPGRVRAARSSRSPSWSNHS